MSPASPRPGRRTPRAAVRRGLDRLLGRVGYRLVRTHEQVPPQPLLPPGAEAELRPDHPRLEELRRRYAAHDTPLAAHAYWGPALLADDLDLRAFRGDNAYVWQVRHLRSNTRLRYYLYATAVRQQDRHGWLGSLGEDGLFGAVTFDYATLPTISRDLLDSVNELAFLDRRLGLAARTGWSVLDIGAGYGRLAHRATTAIPGLHRWYCVDAIPESTFLSEYYLAFRGCGDRARVVPLDEIDATLRPASIDLAVNVHSFSEMTATAASGWFDLLADLGVEHLLIVPNDPDGLFSLESDGERVDLDPMLRRVGYVREVDEPVLADPDLRELTGVRDRFLLYRRH